MAKLAPYEQQPDEGAEAFAAFAVYRDMGPERTQDKTANSVLKHVSLMRKWSSRHKWAPRVRAWDLEVDRRKRIGDLRGIERMRERQVASAMKAQDIANKELDKMLADAENRQKVGTLDPGDVIKLLEMGTKLERLNRGEPGEIIQTTGDDAVDYTVLSLEQLRAMRSVRQTLQDAQKKAADSADEPDGGSAPN